jgi:hypothetical protein
MAAAARPAGLKSTGRSTERFFLKRFFTSAGEGEGVIFNRVAEPAMQSSLDDAFSVPRGLLAVAVGLLVLLVILRTPAQAQTATYVLDPGEGYGIVDCLSDGVACGRIVADAWCEAHGRGAATAFGLASDVTGSTAAAGMENGGRRLPPDAVIVSCSE